MLTDEAFYFFWKQRGAGGLPTGVSGRVVCLLSGGIDSPVAAYRLMKRGCRVHFIHFHSYPILSKASQDKVREIAALLTRSQLRSRLTMVAFGEIQRQVVLSVPPALRVVTSGLSCKVSGSGTSGWDQLKRRTLYGQLFEQ